MTGPTLRGSGVPYDIRKHMPYDAYDKVDFEVPIGTTGDTYDRYRCRMLEMRQSNNILRQLIEKLPAGPIMADAPKFTPSAERYDDADYSSYEGVGICNRRKGLQGVRHVSESVSRKGDLRREEATSRDKSGSLPAMRELFCDLQIQGIKTDTGRQGDE